MKYNSGNSSKFEKKVLESLRKLYPDKLIVPQFKIYPYKHKFDIGFPNERIIVECHGDYWHSHKSVFDNPNTIHPTTNKPVKQMIAVDLLREQVAKNFGYKVIIIWEHEWNLKHEILFYDLFK